MEKVKTILKLSLAGILGMGAIGGAMSSNTPITTATVEQTEVEQYETTTIYDDTLREGTTEIRQEGKDGSKTVKYLISYKNDEEIDREKQSEEIITAPQNKIIVKGTKKYYTCSNGTEFDTQEAKDECEKKITWEKERDKALASCKADSTKTNCWYDKYPGSQIHYTTKRVSTPTTTSTTTNRAKTRTTTQSANGRTGAICKDGWKSSATGRGACSHHGGVKTWLY